MTVVDRSALAGSTVDAARALIGALLVREPDAAGHSAPVAPLSASTGDDDRDGTLGRARRVGRIVEVEAYLGPEDQASHARFGSARRSGVMFGPPGIAYVYLVYGMYDALNVVTGAVGSAAAVLIRAVEPVEGIDEMRESRVELGVRRRRRAKGDASWFTAERRRLSRMPVERLASGPGLVAAAFGVDRSFTGVDLCEPASTLRLEEAPGGGGRRPAIVSGPRVGVGYAAEPWRSAPLRFAVAGHPSVSRPTPWAATSHATRPDPDPGRDRRTQNG